LAVEIADEVGHVGIEYRGDLRQPHRADPIRPLLVLLDLLERDADLLAKRLLTDMHFKPTRPHALADQHIHGCDGTHVVVPLLSAACSHSAFFLSCDARSFASSSSLSCPAASATRLHAFSRPRCRWCDPARTPRESRAR